MPIAKINGVSLNYEVAGEGNPILFLHGYTGSTRDWASQSAVLSPWYKIAAMDHRGMGKSEAPPQEDAYSMPIFANDVLGLFKHLNLGKACVIGHSLGGFIALDFVLAHPELVAALVLVDTSSGEYGTAPEAVALRRKLDETARAQGMDAAFEYDCAHNPVRIERFQRHPEQRELARRKLLTTPRDGYIYVAGAMSKKQNVTARLSEIKVPTLIFWGDEDTPFREPSQTMQRGIANSQMVTIHGVGHSPHEEAPLVLNDALLKFLDTIKW